MISLANVCAVCALAGGLLPAAADNITKHAIESGGQTRNYYLYAPPSSEGKAAPLIVLLHGSGRRGNVLIESWKDLAKKEGIVLVGPDSRDPDGWTLNADGPDFVHDVVEAVGKVHAIDRRRMYLFGHSAGGVYTLYMGLLESRYFAAAAVSAGAFRAPGDFMLIDYAARKIPFAVWVGTEDVFFPPEPVRRTRDAFRAAGLPFELTEIKGHDHNYYRRSDEINKAAWKFLGGVSLPSDPEFQPYNQR